MTELHEAASRQRIVCAGGAAPHRAVTSSSTSPPLLGCLRARRPRSVVRLVVRDLFGRDRYFGASIDARDLRREFVQAWTRRAEDPSQGDRFSLGGEFLPGVGVGAHLDKGRAGNDQCHGVRRVLDGAPVLGLLRLSRASARGFRQRCCVSSEARTSGRIGRGRMSERLLTAEEVAELLAVPVSWVRESTRSGAMPCVRLGRYVRFELAEWRRWLEAAGSRAVRSGFGCGVTDQPAVDPPACSS